MQANMPSPIKEAFGTFQSPFEDLYAWVKKEGAVCIRIIQTDKVGGWWRWVSCCFIVYSSNCAHTCESLSSWLWQVSKSEAEVVMWSATEDRQGGIAALSQSMVMFRCLTLREMTLFSFSFHLSFLKSSHHTHPTSAWMLLSAFLSFSFRLLFIYLSQMPCLTVFLGSTAAHTLWWEVWAEMSEALRRFDHCIPFGSTLASPCVWVSSSIEQVQSDISSCCIVSYEAAFCGSMSVKQQ